VTFDGVELQGPPISRWRLTSQLQRRADMRWFTPRTVLLGRLGEPEGPSVQLWRIAARSRLAFKEGLDWAPQALPAPAPAPEAPQMSRRRRAAAEIGPAASDVKPPF
jgi:hypothetical protein